MTRVWLLILGASATIGFALLMLVIVPQIMLVEIDAPAGLEPYSPAELRGRQVYIANGCLYCHSQQLRDDAFTTDVLRGWGDRPNVPGDYIYDHPHLLGTMRTGPDLINVGLRLPDQNWHLIHLYDPRAVVSWSIMPAFPFLFEERDSAEVGPDDHIVPVRGDRAPHGKVVIARQEAIDLVAYLLSLRRNYPITPPEGDDGTEPADGSTPPEPTSTGSAGAGVPDE